MRILLSNDDGYFSPGIELLSQALGDIAHVTVVAPERDRSGASNSLTLDRPLYLRRASNGFYFVNGTPTDCVHLAVTGMEKADHAADGVIRAVPQVDVAVPVKIHPAAALAAGHDYRGNFTPTVRGY